MDAAGRGPNESVTLAQAALWRSLAAGALVWTGPAYPARSGVPAEPDTLTLAYEVSGLRVIQRIDRATEGVAVRLYLLGGTRQTGELTAGIERLLLETSAYGTAHFPGARAQRAMAQTACRVTLEAEVDWTVFGCTGLAEDLDTAWAVLADRLLDPTLSDSAVRRARAHLLAEAHRRNTNPDLRVERLATEALFEGHPYALDPNGTETSLTALTAEDLRNYARRELVTSRMLLVVVGNVERAHLESLIAPTLGRLPHGDYHWDLPPPAPVLRGHWVVEDRRLPTAYVLGLFPGPRPGSHDYWAFRVATAVLSGWVFNAVRAESSLSYAAFAPFHDEGIPVGGMYATTPRPLAALPLMVRQIENLEAWRLDPLRLAQFIDEFRFGYLAETSSADGQADLLARAELYLGGYRQAGEFLERLHRTAPIDLRRVANLYMRRIQFAYLGDTSRMKGRW